MTPLQQRPIKIPLVESDREHVDRLRERFSSVRQDDFVLEWASELSGALAILTQGGIDTILLDLDLADSSGMATFERTYAFAPDVPIIVITDEADDEVAIATVQGGAQDYMVKAELESPVLARSVRHARPRWWRWSVFSGGCTTRTRPKRSRARREFCWSTTMRTLVCSCARSSSATATR
jgi:DNA-binding response OmpR family regulator